MRHSSWPILLWIFLATIGAVLSWNLLQHHRSGYTASGIVASICGRENAGCDAVSKSRWSVFPPAAADDVDSEERAASTDRRAGLPVAALGLFYFTAVAIWSLFLRRVRYRLLLVVTVAGCCASIVFLGLMAFAIGEWCPLCVLTHFANFAVVALVWLARPAADFKPSGDDRRVLIATVCTILLACTSLWQTFRAYALTDEVDALAEQSRDAETLELAYMSGVKREIAIEADDAIIAPSPGLYATLVVFSDLECPSCAKFDRLLKEEITPLFKGHIRIVFKHFPLKSLHPHAMQAARAAEAARLQGKFWEMHERIVEHRLELARVKYSELADAIGIDAKKLLLDMYSDVVDSRIKKTMRQGERIGVDGTPTVFLNGREVKTSVRDLMGFWKRRAESLRQSRAARGQSW